jgi:winged helix domain-containing protein/ATPase family protein associated with various cellular activities (AAA)
MNKLDPLELLIGELHWLDLVLLAEVIRLRRSRPRPADQFQGLYIADIDVDHLLAESLGGDAASTSPAGAAQDVDSELLLQRLVDNAREARADLDARSAAGNPDGGSPLDRIAGDFDLSTMDRNILLVACAPDLEPRFETLYAYVQDDVTRRRPTIGLALKLLCSDSAERWSLRSRFEAAAPLVRHGLVQVTDEQPFLSRILRADDRVVDELVGLAGQIDQRLQAFAELQSSLTEPLYIPAVVAEEIPGWIQAWSADAAVVLPLAMFDGPDPQSAQPVCLRLAQELDRPLLVVRLGALCDGQISGAEAVRAIRREVIFQRALLLLAEFDRLAEPDQRAVEIRRSLEPLLRVPPVPVAIAGPRGSIGNLYDGLAAIRFPLPVPSLRERLRIWDAELAREIVAHKPGPAAVAAKFLLSGRQIAAGAELAVQMARLRGDSDGPTTADLHSAARQQSHQGLAALARKVEPVYVWDDIVLARATSVQLHEIASAVEHRQRVLSDWGFGRYSRGRGLNVLFSGASGTGKTMAAEVLAKELGLDLYEIDLATVVSKYIGETEKNLKRIFLEAHSSNAILFFDEADALFGKRSEVRDAHDRYANLEIAYLLQLMEEYEGMAILATNLSRNVDDAFARRMQYVVEFPLPDRVLRMEIWRRAFPSPTPMGDVDLAFMAEHFELAGGGIRGAAMGAATLAAADSGMVEMKHLTLAVAREYQKLGKLPSQSEFGPYYLDVLKELRVG